MKHFMKMRIYGEDLKTFLKFNTKDKNWEEVARMNQARSDAHYTLYEERIVVMIMIMTLTLLKYMII